MKTFVCFCCLAVSLLLNQGVARPLSAIHFEGLKKSKQSYLERYIQSRVGEEANVNTIKRDVQQLQNLSSIAQASFRLDTLAQGQVLVFEIEEAITIFPIVNFGGIRGNVWFQLGFKELNLQGKGQELALVYQNNDRRNNGNLFYKIPYLGKSQWGMSLSAVRWASVEPLYFGDEGVFYEYRNTSLGGTVIRSFQPTHKVEVGGNYFVEVYEKSTRHANEMTPGPERARQEKLLFKVVHQYNRISDHRLYLEGWDNTLNAQRIWNLDDQSTFDIILNDTRYFKRLGRQHTLAARLRLGISSNNDSPFAPFVLDSHVNIRGVGNRIDRGTAVAVLNMEYRHVLFELNQFACQAVGFSDFGTWRQPGGQLKDLQQKENLIFFAGGGLRVIYKRAHNAVFRIDYGFNILNGRGNGLVLGLGQYF
ncbi:MAG: BamA/TamA family outer membrane protein [Bacteroidota bacterium]